MRDAVELFDAYARAFDAPLFVVDGRLARRLDRPDRDRVRGSSVLLTGDLWPRLAGKHGAATVDGMARLLWGSEIQALVGQPTNRRGGLDWIHRNLALDQVRAGVISALRGRLMNKWEETFWTRFDAEAPVEQAA